MAIAEIIIGEFIRLLFEKLASPDLIKLARSEGISSQLNKWKNTLIQIKAVLVDAGQKHITDTAIQLWLKNLQVLAYDIDDLLDDLATEALRRRLAQESQASNTTDRVRKLIPTCCNRFTPRTIMYGRKMSSKLDEITNRLHNIAEEKNSLGLNVNIESSKTTYRRMEETSLVDESNVVGREGDKEVLLKKLLGDEPCNRNVSIVPIVGMGGIGKTTLAQLLYNDENVKQHFEPKAWVCVSDEFDIFMISKIIYQAVTGENREFPDLNLLQVALQDKLSERRFLLVLDDVWNENIENWERLQRPFRVGAPGSKIIVTTRSSEVVSTMGRVEAYPLTVLSGAESLVLFAHHALGEKNFDAHPTIKCYGEGIVKKCKGLPLALIALGRVLSTKTNDEDWKELLNSDIWSLHENKGNILPALRLSYHYLPPHLKQMFAPKDYVFDKDELVLLWMGEGFVHQSNISQSMESLGCRYFEELESRSFFQRFNNEESGYIMHDLMNDLATSIATEFFFRLEDKMTVDESNEALEQFRHFSFIRQRYGVYRKFKAFQRAKRLRTFMAVSVKQANRWAGFHLSSKILVELLPQLHFLRVLSLSEYFITEVPTSIGNMKHLRYLNFSQTHITYLPEQVSDLYNLQTLLVRGCRKLTSLPSSFAKLIYLRHVDIRDTPMLKRIPLGIGGLTSLQTLSKVIIEGTNGFNLMELKGLLNLRGRLSMKRLHQVRYAIHAKEANLMQKEGLNDLEMEWSDVFDDSRKETIEYEVIEGLRPHDKLRNLEIVYYGGRKLPSWVGDPSFYKLTRLTLRGCRNCKYLPTLGQLPSLQKLFIGSMDGIRTVGSELLGPASSPQGIAFPSLEILEFRNMSSWEIWSTNNDNNNEIVGLFPCLCELTMVGCPKLVEVSIRLIPSLRILHIDGCYVAVLRGMVGVAPSILKLQMRKIQGLTQLHRAILEHLGAVEDLSIEECKELRYLWESEAKAFKILVNLKVLEVRYCEELVSLGESESNFGKDGLLTSLRQVKIMNCPKLERYDCQIGIEKLEVAYCDSITSFPFSTRQKISSSTLRTLSISGCENMDEPEEENWFLFDNFASLEFLEIYRWPNLRSFPEGCLIHLTTLMISDCEGIESFPESGYLVLRFLYIGNCKNLKWLPDHQLSSLSSLVWLRVRDCPSIDYSFPRGLWPPNLSFLDIGGLKKPISEWGPQNFPNSLVALELDGENSGVVAFSEVEDGGYRSKGSRPSSLLLPQSLTALWIRGFEDLESVSQGQQHLTSLEELEIGSCPKLRDLPEMLLPSLSSLSVFGCPKLKERCRSNRRDSYWPLISQIPFNHIN